MIAKLRLAATAIPRMALLALVLGVMVQPASAEQKKQPPQKQQQKQEPQPSDPSPNAMKMAREILDLKNSAALFEPMVPGVIERVRLLHMKTNPNLQKTLNEVALHLRKVFASRTDDLMDDISWLYASRFSESELKEILVFYRSPIGKRVIEFEPKVFDDAMLGLKDWQEKFGEEVLARFRSEMKKRGHDL